MSVYMYCIFLTTEINEIKKSANFQEDTLSFYDFIHVFVITSNYHLNCMYNYKFAFCTEHSQKSQNLSLYVALSHVSAFIILLSCP